MSRNELNCSNDLPKPIDTIDLHGFNKAEATRRTTDFLDRSTTLSTFGKAWVLIITGSGAHSTDGPVLRGAIEALLTKRKMDFHLLKGRGSFLVNASSGIVLYEPSQPRDSKVTVAPPSTSGFTDGPNHIRRSLLKQQLSENRGESRKALKKQFYTIRNEGAAFDEAISKSLKEEERIKEENEEHKDLLEQALKISLAEKQKEAEEEEKLCAAIELSKKECIVHAMDEDEQIRKLMAISKAEFDQQNDPDVYLQKVIELSRKEENNNCALRNGEDNEDERLLKALELSVVDF